MSIIEKFNLTGKTAVVTGASRGLGQAIAVGLAEAGADIVSVSRKETAPETAKLVQANGRRFVHISRNLLDISAEGCHNLIDDIVLEVGKIDILVNNAGLIRRATADAMSETAWDAVMQVNVKASFFLAQAAAHKMAPQGGGKIIFTSSVLAFEGGLMVLPYTTSKHAVNGMVKALANEWAPHKINVNGVAPGYFATDMTQALQDNSERYKALVERIPAGRFGDPVELKGIYVYLASDAASYAHGTIYPVDGGWLAR